MLINNLIRTEVLKSTFKKLLVVLSLVFHHRTLKKKKKKRKEKKARKLILNASGILKETSKLT